MAISMTLHPGSWKVMVTPQINCEMAKKPHLHNRMPWFQRAAALTPSILKAKLLLSVSYRMFSSF
jgi:hypothetical protein